MIMGYRQWFSDKGLSVASKKYPILYEKLKELAYTNFENGDEIQLTGPQLMGVVLEVLDLDKEKNVLKTFFETKLGKVCMN